MNSLNAICRRFKRQNKEQIESWIYEACSDNGYPEIAKKITWSFNSRFTSRAGDACLKASGLGNIRLSTKLWGAASDLERYQTVKHEACHIICDTIFGRNTKTHGREWSRCMASAGLVSNKYHKIDTSEFKQKRKKYDAKCGCRIHAVGAIRRKRILLGSKYRCKICKQALVLV